MKVLMEKVYWRLHSAEKKDCYEEFVKEVTEHNNFIDKDNDWNPDEVICDAPKLRIIYGDFGKNKNGSLKVMVEAKNQQNITMGEALFSLHNQSVGFFADTMAYFEGLKETTSKDGIPTFLLWTGT